MKPNAFVLKPPVCIIRIFAKGDWRECLIDYDDLDRVSGIHWGASWSPRSQTWYVQSYARSSAAWIHRLIMNPPKGLEVDHINHDGLDNRKQNLRIVTRAENAANMKRHKPNTSGVLGVCWDAAKGGFWKAGRQIAGRPRYLGRFKHREEAIAALAYATRTGDWTRKTCRGHMGAVAKSLGVSVSLVIKVRAGKYVPNTATAQAVRQALAKLEPWRSESCLSN